MGVFDFATDWYSQRSQQKAAHKAADVSQAAAAKAEEGLTEWYGKAEEPVQPWLKAGEGSLNIMSDLMGLNGPERQTAAYARFQADPAFRFQVEQAEKAMERSALKKGNIFSGNFATELSDYNRKAASSEYGNYFNRLEGLSGRGQAAGTTLSQLRANRGTALANTRLGLGSNLASLALYEGQGKSDMYNAWKQDLNQMEEEAMRAAGSIYGGGR